MILLTRIELLVLSIIITACLSFLYWKRPQMRALYGIFIPTGISFIIFYSMSVAYRAGYPVAERVTFSKWSVIRNQLLLIPLACVMVCEAYRTWRNY